MFIESCDANLSNFKEDKGKMIRFLQNILLIDLKKKNKKKLKPRKEFTHEFLFDFFVFNIKKIRKCEKYKKIENYLKSVRFDKTK